MCWCIHLVEVWMSRHHSLEGGWNVRGTPRFCLFSFISWTLSVHNCLFQGFRYLLFRILPLIFSAVLLIFLAHPHQHLHPFLLFFWHFFKVISTMPIFWHFNIISHKFKSCCINSVSPRTWSQTYPYIPSTYPCLCVPIYIFLGGLVLYSTNPTVDSGSVPSKGP
jgi:hypothetical protein